MLKFDIYRDGKLVLGKASGKFLNDQEIEIENMHCQKDLASMIQPKDSIIWKDAASENNKAVILRVSPLFTAGSLNIGRRAKLNISYSS
jgi:hypothetical protein